VSFTVLLIVFGLVFLAELPDKTALASLMLGARYPARYVFAGIAAAFAVHVGLAIAAGSLLGLLPHRWLQAVVGALFVLGAGMMLFHHDEDEEEAVDGREPAAPSFWRVAATGFGVVLVAEFGDLTQILTANLAARYHDPVAVGIGAVLALWAVAALAVVGGKTLLRYVPMRWVQRAAAALMLVLAGFSIYRAVAG